MTLWQNDEGYKESYLSRYAGYYSPRRGYQDEDGYLYIMSGSTTSLTSPGTGFRPAGWRRCCRRTRNVAECSVIGVADELKGEVPVGWSC